MRHGSAHQQEQLEPDRPLQRVDVALLAVPERHHAAAGVALDVGADPLARAARSRRCACWRIVSPDAVTVWPNMIWPTSMRDVRVRVHRLGELQRGRRELLRPLGRRSCGTARASGGPAAPSSASMVASVDAMLPATPRLLPWMCSGCGTPSSCTARASVRTTWRGVTLPVRVRLVDVELALVELEGRDAARVDDLHAHRLAGVDRPADVVADALEARRPRPASRSNSSSLPSIT